MSNKPSARKFIELDPPQYLYFQRPFNVAKTTILKIKNTSNATIVFKVKTTAPNSYIVVPNCGEVKVNEVREIEIKRNPSKEEFPPDYKCKDKFLVQSMQISDDEIAKYSSDPKELQKHLMTKFQEVDKQKKTNPLEVKEILGEDRLNCVYQLPTEGSGLPETASVDELASSRESLAATTVDAAGVINQTSNIASSPLAATKPDADENAELAAAREKIKELQQALKNYKQDQTIHDLTKGSSTAARDVKAQAPLKRANPNKNVIPIEIVALVALIAFLVGAFCF